MFALLLAASAWLADRPLVLPRGSAQAQMAWEILDLSVAGPQSTHFALGQVDAGLGSGLQVGAGATVEVGPDLEFQWAAARILAALGPQAALRVDGGPYRFSAGGSSREYGFAGGVGLSARIALIPRTLTLSICRQIALPPLGPVFAAGWASADDLFTLVLNHSNLEATVGLPLVLTIQPLSALAFALRGGARYGWGGGNFSQVWAPFGADVIVVGDRLDLTVSFESTGEDGFNRVLGRAMISATF